VLVDFSRGIVVVPLRIFLFICPEFLLAFVRFAYFFFFLFGSKEVWDDEWLVAGKGREAALPVEVSLVSSSLLLRVGEQ